MLLKTRMVVQRSTVAVDLIDQRLKGRLRLIVGDARRLRLAAVIVVHPARRRRRLGVYDVIIFLADAGGFAFVMVERQIGPFHEGKVSGDISVGDLDHAVLHVLRMDKFDLIDQVQFFEDRSTNKAIEITTRNQPVFSRGH